MRVTRDAHIWCRTWWRFADARWPEPEGIALPGILGDATFARLRARATVHVDADLNRDNPEGRGANVTIQTTSGSSFSHRVDAPRGHSSRGGVTWEELRDKWRDGLPDCDVERMLALAQRLEHLEDVKELADAFIAPN